MKLKKSLIAVCVLALGGTAAFSQVPNESQAPPPPPPPGAPGGKMRENRQKMRDNLTPEERARFDAARNKAAQDPEIQELKKAAEAANRELFQAMRKKMLEIDPGLADIIKKHEAGKGPGGPGGPGGKGDKPGKGQGHQPPPGLANLTPEEREQLKAAREKAKEDPAVLAAEEVKKNAQTPEDRQAAGEAYREAMHKAMVDADPSIEPILEKLGPPPPPPGKPPGDMDERTDPPTP